MPIELTTLAIKRWVEAQPERGVVGTARNEYQCLVATFLAGNGAPCPYVDLGAPREHADLYMEDVHTDVVHPLSDEVGALARRFDALADARRHDPAVTREEALALFD